jgi:hypothetical protein
MKLSRLLIIALSAVLVFAAGCAVDAGFAAG